MKATRPRGVKSLDRRVTNPPRPAVTAAAPHRGIPPQWLPLCFILLLAGFCLLPRVNRIPRLEWSFLGAAAALLVYLLILQFSVRRAGRVLCYRFLAVKSHWVQCLMHAFIYTYWGMYWPQVYPHIPLILGQVAFLYALDMLVCWTRRDEWILGFGPIPIIFSMNLFLWFRDDWFWLQFLMIATGVLCKEFIKWDRDGRRVHVFNPSGIALFVFSVGLLFTNNTGITWGPEIAKSLHLPPNIYFEVFLVGLVVQGLFSVTLMTLSAAAVLYGLNLAFTHVTGVYWFVDSNIPVSVFIGLHLLVTDPATSPRTSTGKIVFGGLYGAAVFALDGILGAFSAPQFYDKLLCVPFLNLSVRAIDRYARAFAARFHPLNLTERWGARNLNFAHIAIWAVLFTAMSATGFVGHSHPGQFISFWQKACDQGRFNACRTWVHALGTNCRGNDGASCLAYGKVLTEGKLVSIDRLQGGEAIGRACDLGVAGACVELAGFARKGGNQVLDRACDERGDPAACYVAGGLYSNGQGAAKDDARAAALFQKACDSGFPRACGRLGQSYLLGRGAEKNPTVASLYYRKACGGGDASSCYGLAMLYLRGTGVRQSEDLAEQSMQRACALGMRMACMLADPNMAQINPNMPPVSPGAPAMAQPAGR